MTTDPRVFETLFRSDFQSFAGKFFRLLMPGSPFQVNWHIAALAWHLEQVRHGRIKRLIINLPPRSLKSIMTSVMFPAFALGHCPTMRIIALSYGADLAIKHANDFRAVMNSPLYRRLFPETRISNVKNTETELVTTHHGFRLASSVDGTLTGRGGDIVIIDDPLKPIDAISDSKRERVNDWFFNTVLSRLDDKKTGAIVIVMQRLHVDDLTGMLLRNAADEWTVLNLPAIAEREETIRISDTRYHTRRVGDLLHAEREPQRVLDSLRAQLGSDTFAAQYQQAPIPPGGAMIKRDWVQRYEQLPIGRSSFIVLQSWDTAAKEGGLNDYSACTTWRYDGKKYYLLHVLRDRFDYPTLKARAISHARAYNSNMILIEDTGVGTALLAELQNAGLSAIGVTPEHDKQTRMSIQSGKFESGQIFFPKDAPWLADLEVEVFAFPNARHDDQVDSISQALSHKMSEFLWDQKSLDGLSRFVSGLAFPF